MEPLADAVGLRRFHLGFGVVDIVDCQEELVIVFVDAAASHLAFQSFHLLCLLCRDAVASASFNLDFLDPLVQRSWHAANLR